MSDAWRLIVREPGTADAIICEDIDLPAPGPGEVRIRNQAVGVNFIDIYYRTGLYPAPSPILMGTEGAGIVEAVGEDVTDFTPGDRVAYFAKRGSYATHVVADAVRSFPLPDTLDSETAAAALLKGLTAWSLVERCARVEPSQSVLVHAAAGGVGSILVQWLKAVGAHVIAHSGSPEKAAVATRLGADVSLHGGFDDLAAAVRAATDGRGVHAVLDGVGKDSWDASLASVAKRGIIVSYGNASGPVPPVAPLVLGRAGSVFLNRPTVYDWIELPADRAQGWSRLTQMLASGAVKIEIGQRYPLSDAAEAHRALESRKTVGATVLLP
ncbi:quinone oxidoreductase family protein [Sphingomonas colocasiae]|uniref:Quinone oxidoreductase n=1 Tax=Sphingomonas colocasiae TaxID=1848973 RepID=A0ABS7PTR9_9SPHN|nr:quinone oxidoreductase [Sphingomonas colocasiae]MBY8824727.1 quinone oxidoreductase [Sphingomonas colocasiae]